MKNVVSRQISHSLCVYVNWLQTRWERVEQHFFTGPLTAEGPKPQALPRPTLLCNSRPKAIMHGACQTGPALSHNHTCIRACVIVFTYMKARWSSVAGWHGWKLTRALESEVQL